MKGKVFTDGPFAFILPARCSSEPEWSSTLLPGLNEHCQLQQSLLFCSSPEKPCITSAACNYSYCLPLLGIGWKWENNTFSKVISRTKKPPNHYQHPFFAISISSALIGSQQVLVLNRCNFNPLCNEKGEKYGKVMRDKENWQLFSHLIASVVLHRPCQKNDPNPQNNHFFKIHSLTLLLPKTYCQTTASKCPRRPSQCSYYSSSPPSLRYSSSLRSIWKICRDPLLTSGKDLGSTALHERL